MGPRRRPVVWTEGAPRDLDAAITFVADESLEGAIRLLQDIPVLLFLLEREFELLRTQLGRLVVGVSEVIVVRGPRVLDVDVD